MPRRSQSTPRMVGGADRSTSDGANHYTLVYINNHTHVWGSWYDPSASSWGYACCHSTVNISYCTGQAGIEAAAASSTKNLLTSSSRPVETVPQPVETVQESSRDAEERRRAAKNAFGKDRVGEGEVQLDKERLAQAIKEEKKRKAWGDDDGRSGKRAKGDEPHEITEEQLGEGFDHYPIARVLTPVIEAYRMNRSRMEDPMANYVDTEV